MRKSLVSASLLFLSSATAAHATNVTVDQDHSTFTPATLSIKAGDTVHFNNHDTVTHDVRVKSPNGDVNDKGLQKPGEDIKYTFEKPGRYEVSCAIHPAMKLAVTVR